MAYDSNTGIVTAPIGIYDVQRAVSKSSPDLGTLITTGIINKWAKYKPVRLATIDTTPQLNNNLTWRNDATWWKGTSGNSGITFLTFTSIASLKTAIDNKTAVWGYERPNAVYRQIDFNRYNGHALPPIYAVSASDAFTTAGAKCTIMAAKAPANGDNLTLADIGGIVTKYFSVAIYEGDTLKLIHSASTTIGSGGDTGDITLEIPYNDGVNGGYENILIAGHTYKGYAFLSSHRYNCATAAVSGTYIPLPHENESYGIQSFDIAAKQYSQWMSVDAAVLSAGSTVVNWVAYMYGNSGQAATISLVDLNGNVISGQTKNIDFSNGEVVTNPSGRKLRSNANTALTMPSYAPESYRVKLVSQGMPDMIAVIGYELESVE